MMGTRESIIARIKANLPFGADPDGAVGEESVLADLGVNSLHLITMLLVLQREYSLNIDCVTQSAMPKTVGDLVTLVERGREGGMGDGTPSEQGNGCNQ